MIKLCRLLTTITACLILVTALAGCASVPDQDENSPQPASTASAKIPAGGISLADTGIQHGPEGFSVPEGLVVEEVIDQSNLVTLVMNEEQGAILYAYLIEHLATMGFVIEGQSADSIYFTTEGWEGAYTQANGVAGLTLRNNPGSFETPGG